ncbi:MAG: hypothetical protein ACP5FK_11185, partial [bacterium]
DEIRQLGLEFGIVTPYTSYLVVEDESDLVKFANEEYRILGGAGAVDEVATTIYDTEATGEQSVYFSRAVNNLAEGYVYEIEENRATNFINGKSFMNIRGTWTENNYQGEDVQVVEYGSDIFFDLLGEEPELGDYLSLGNVIFNYQGQWYNVIIR